MRPPRFRLRSLALMSGLALLGAACGNGDDGTRTADGAVDGPGSTRVTMARASWDTGYFQAEVFAQLLGDLGYEVSDPADNELGADLFYPAAARGEVDFWPNGWFPIHQPMLDTEVPGVGKVADAVELVGYEVEAGALQGYLIDKRSADELGITSMENLKDPELAAHFDGDGDGKADLIGCNAGWGCEEAINLHMEEFGWRDTIEHVQGEYSALMADTFARAERGEPVLYYTWTPNFTVAKLVPGEDVVWIGAPSLPGEDTVAEGVEGCVADPCELGFPLNDIRVVANRTFLEDNPTARALFEVVEIPAADVFAQNLAMNGGENSAADIEAHAEGWIADHGDVVEQWLETARAAA